MESNKEIMSRLKFIGKVKRGEKINVKGMFVQLDGLLTSFSRMLWRPDNRINTLDFLQTTVNRAFEIILTYRNSQSICNQAICSNIARDLYETKKGIANLRDTYVKDTKFACDMDTLLELIDANIQEMNLECIPKNLDLLHQSNLNITKQKNTEENQTSELETESIKSISQNLQ